MELRMDDYNKISVKDMEDICELETYELPKRVFDYLSTMHKRERFYFNRTM